MPLLLSSWTCKGSKKLVGCLCSPRKELLPRRDTAAHAGCAMLSIAERGKEKEVVETLYSVRGDKCKYIILLFLQNCFIIRRAVISTGSPKPQQERSKGGGKQGEKHASLQLPLIICRPCGCHGELPLRSNHSPPHSLPLTRRNSATLTQ